jgi:O-antigen ligase
MAPRDPSFRGLEVGVFLSFLGAYLSVSLIGLGTGLVLIFGLYRLLTAKRFGALVDNPLLVPMGILMTAILASILLAEPYDYEKPLGKLRYLFCFFLFAWYFVERPQAKETLLSWARWLAIGLGILAVLQLLGLVPMRLSEVPHSTGRWFMARGLAFHHSPFAATMILLHQVFLAHWLLSKRTDRNRVYAIPLALASLAVLCSYSRGPWLAWLGSTFAVVLFVSWRAALGTLAAALAGAVGLFFANAGFRQRVIEMRPETNAERLELWRVCLEMFKDAPLLGQGFYSFGSRYQKYTDWHRTHEHFPVEAHNMYLDLLSGTGLIGLGAFLFLLASGLLLAFRVFASLPEGHEERPWALASFGMLVSFLITGLFDKTFYMTQTLVPHLFFLAVMVSVAIRHPAAERRRPSRAKAFAQ